jgi:Peptidase family M28
VDLAGLRATVEALAAIERGSTSEGERDAAEWIADRLGELGCEASVEEERAFPAWAPTLAAVSAVGAVAGLAGMARRRGSRLAAAVGALAAAAIADDISNGPRVTRGATMEKRPTWNVVGTVGDPAAARTVVVLAHHDAAPTGRIFDPGLQRWLGRRFPGVIERIDTALPLWWPVVGAPVAVAYGAARGRRAATAVGVVGCLGATAAFVDIARSPTVPGANDNLTGVAALLALADRLRERPQDGVRVLLVSCGSEESLQGGIHGFAARHFPSLDPDATWFLNLDSVGSPRLALVEGEGPLVMEDYPDRTFRDLVARAAERAGVRMRRGMRARSSTDSIVPGRARFPIATLTSLDRDKLISNYHLMSDTPENVRYETVADAVAVAEAVIRWDGAA